MAGYYGYSKSNNAIDAESKHKYPITKATAYLANVAGITKKFARQTLEEMGPCEWHHTSKFYNETKYYDVKAALDKLHNIEILIELKKVHFEERISAAIQPNLDSLDNRIAAANKVKSEIAAEVGCTVEIITKAYYDDWGDE